MKTYSEGWDAYAAGRPIDDCETDAARRGWWAANAAEAAAEYADYLVDHGVPVETATEIVACLTPGIEEENNETRTRVSA